MPDWKYSNEFHWIPSRTGEVEYYGSQTCTVNVSVLKLMLSQQAWPVLEQNLDHIEYDEAGGKVVIAKESERPVRREGIEEADITLPLVAAFVPIARHPTNGTILWATDMVDGFHRVAAAKIRGLTTMPLVLAPPLASAIATKPNPLFSGAIAPESDFLAFNPNREASFCANLTGQVGTRFNFGVVED